MPNISPEKRQRIFQRDGHRCVLCHSSKRLGIDHVIPVSQDGTDNDNNLQVLCTFCNQMKNNRSMEWARKQVKERIYLDDLHRIFMEKHQANPRLSSTEIVDAMMQDGYLCGAANHWEKRTQNA